ncbi:transposase [uncultured Paraglaciecola sp.]|mgnify:CR=1 FL=1|uniref:transposase n=1 Tax=uncultured Paraglaciecola sp. TaxID=1765024 RepID=UPI0026220325|nr:transposase [uncultured Paraglaciecola sp.]
MSRPLRLEFAGALYHVTSRGNDKKKIYFQDTDFKLFLKILNDACEQFNWIIHAYCLMTNHYHLLVETPDANLCKGMRQLNGVFTQSMNRKHQRVGHLFQGRYKAILVDKNAFLLELCRYIVLNPVRANLVNFPHEWQWSSWHCTIGSQASPPWLATDFLLKLFSEDRKQAINQYTHFVAKGGKATIWNKLQHQVFLGDDAFIEKYQPLQSARIGDLKEIPLKQRRSTPLTLQQYQAQFDVSRDEAIMMAYKSGGYTLKEIGTHFGLHYSRVSRIVAKGKT